MSITIPLSFAVLAGFSLLLFVAVTVLCHRQGLFDNAGGYLSGLDSLFALLIYAVLWAIPSLLAWAVYATWFRGV